MEGIKQLIHIHTTAQHVAQPWGRVLFEKYQPSGKAPYIMLWNYQQLLHLEKYTGSSCTLTWLPTVCLRLLLYILRYADAEELGKMQLTKIKKEGEVTFFASLILKKKKRKEETWCLEHTMYVYELLQGTEDDGDVRSLQWCIRWKLVIQLELLKK